MDGKKIFGIAIAIIIGLYLAFTDLKKDINTELSPDQLHFSLVENTRYVSVEDIAHRLIIQDPSLMLIDVRSPEAFAKFNLEGAINIPLDSLLNEAHQDYLGQDVYDVVLYSNGTMDADKAWMLCKRKGYNNNAVMFGGLNAWVENILRPVPDGGPYDKAEDELYQFRRGASQYFGKAGAAPTITEEPKAKKKVVKREKKEVEGGCG